MWKIVAEHAHNKILNRKNVRNAFNSKRKNEKQIVFFIDTFFSKKMGIEFACNESVSNNNYIIILYLFIGL